MRSKSFRRLRISLRHRWIAGESISYARLTFSHSVSVFRPLSRLAQYTQPIERSERYVFPTAKIPNRRRHKFCFHFVFFFPSKIKLLFLRTRMTTTTGLSLSLSLSLFFVPTDTCARVLCVRFSLEDVRDKSACSPPQKKDAKNYCLGCIQNPKLTSRQKRGWTRDLFFPPQRIFSSSSKSSTSTTTCRQHQLLYSTTATVAFTTRLRRRRGLRFRNKDEARRPRTLVLRVLLVPLFLSQEEEGLLLYRGRVAVVMLLLLLLLARERRILRTTASTPTLA